MRRKIVDTISVGIWAVGMLVCLVAFLATGESFYGFLLVFFTVWFHSEDREYREKYNSDHTDKDRPCRN